MGHYLNPGEESFKKALNSDIYIDKTMLLQYLNKVINSSGQYICVSRPRRFGKTIAMNMIAAYYCCSINGKALFEGLNIFQDKYFDKYANKYNVVKLEAVKMGLAELSVDQWIAKLQKILMHDFKKEYPDVEYVDENDICLSMMDVYQQTGIQFVIIIDEWDVLFRERKDDFIAQKQYLDFLRKWLKDQDYVALAYMTGILPIKKYGKHSALNMFHEFSMEDQQELEEFVGFTDDEVRALCNRYGADYNQCRAWYDGYCFSKVKEIYNPLSVVLAVPKNSFKNYWNKTESFEALKVYIDMNFDGLRDSVLALMAGERRKIDVSNFSNDMVTFNSSDDVMTLLIHLGYLGYDLERSEVFIPNNEIRAVFAASVKHSKEYESVAIAIKTADELLEATLEQNSKKVAELVENAHLETSHLQYNDENALSYTISLAYYTARNKYTMVRELPAGQGFADMVFIPRAHHPEMPAMIVELKWNHSAKTAIKQIKDKKYPESLKDFTGKILLVGINYSKKTKKHTCKIEQV